MLFKDIKNNIKKYFKLAKSLHADARIPLVSKLLLAAAIGYFLLPFDLIPDFIPVLGQLDDVIIVPGLFFIAVKLIPKKIYQQHWRKLSKKK